MLNNDWGHQNRPNIRSAVAIKPVIIRDVNPDFSLINGRNIVVEDDEAL